MPNYHDLVETILTQTLACQDRDSPESKARLTGRYAPIGSHIPSGGDGSYPTTDAAMEALAELADRFSANDADLKFAISRDSMRKLASEVFGELLNDVARETDPRQRWPKIRERLKERARQLGKNIVHYVPVWLFLDEDVEPFDIGPVRFVPRADWLVVIAQRRGQESTWMPGVRQLWAGKSLKGGSIRAGLSGAMRAMRRRPLRLSTLWDAFIAARRHSESPSEKNARSVARLVRPDQWVGCAEVDGFENEESRRRGLLAIRVALDTVRLTLAGRDRQALSTVADSTVPLSIDRLNQQVGEDLAHGFHFNRPGLSAAPGAARDLVKSASQLFEAAGLCISAATSTSSSHACPILADRWFNAVHWFGRACLADVDFVAVVMHVIALDVLSGGLEEGGILELIARLTGTPVSHPVLADGTTLKKLVENSYELRSKVAHGSILAVHRTLDAERAQLESLAATAMAHYVLELKSYAEGGGIDDRNAFRDSLPVVVP